MTSLRAALTAARDRLLTAAVAEDELEAEVEAEVLLRHALGSLTRAQLYSHLEDSLGAPTAARFEALITRRLGHEPTAYITGHREFFGLDLRITPDVLIPRPETEMLVEASLELCRNRGAALRIVDVGTGSGAIAIALASALPSAEVYATDVSRAALALAFENARAHGVERRVAFTCGDLLTGISDYVDLILANLPYVTTGEWRALPPESRDHEPRIALDGGEDGLDLIRRLIPQALRHLRPGGSLLLELGEGQADTLRRELVPSIKTWSVRDGLEVERVLALQRGV